MVIQKKWSSGLLTLTLLQTGKSQSSLASEPQMGHVPSQPYPSMVSFGGLNTPYIWQGSCISRYFLGISIYTLLHTYHASTWSIFGSPLKKNKKLFLAGYSPIYSKKTRGLVSTYPVGDVIPSRGCKQQLPFHNFQSNRNHTCCIITHDLSRFFYEVRPPHL